MRPEQTEALRRNAQELGAELERRPAERVVVVGFAQRTPLGDTWGTWDGILEGKSGTQAMDFENWRTNIGAPVKFDPIEEGIPPKSLKRDITNIGAMAIVTTQEALKMAGLLNEEGKLIADVNPDRVGNFLSTGFGSSQTIIDTHAKLNEPKEDGTIDKRANSKRNLGVFDGIRAFPEETPSSASIEIGLQGWSQNSSEACATGLSSVADAVESIKSGRNSIAVAGGLEDSFTYHGDVAIGMFAQTRAVSARNDDPQHASRPFDRDRDGFVLASGGGAMVVADLNVALEHNLPIFAEVIGYGKASDGLHRTQMRHERVAKLILDVIRNKKANKGDSEEFFDIDAIFAHATSTEEGDKNEATALRLALGEMLNDIDITAIKGQTGHMAGGAGINNAITAVQALMFGQIPPVGNLENPDETEITVKRGSMEEETFSFQDLALVKGQAKEKPIQTALVLGYGFGGYNSAVLLRRWNG